MRKPRNMLSADDVCKLDEFQQIVFDGIEKALRMEGHHKSYEGAIRVCLPSYFGGSYFVDLDCYVLGPSRHYEWPGKTLSEAVDKAMSEVKTWIKELDNERG